MTVTTQAAPQGLQLEPTATGGITSLPIEILYVILDYLFPPDICNLASVSRLFHNFVRLRPVQTNFFLLLTTLYSPLDLVLLASLPHTQPTAFPDPHRIHQAPLDARSTRAAQPHLRPPLDQSRRRGSRAPADRENTTSIRYGDRIEQDIRIDFSYSEDVGLGCEVAAEETEAGLHLAPGCCQRCWRYP